MTRSRKGEGMDQELVVRAQQGDQRAFETLTAADHPRLFRVAHGILGDPHLAEDATQQAFLDIWRNIPRLRDPAKFEGWSYRLLVHACYAEAKAQARLGGLRRRRSRERADWRVTTYGSVVERDRLERAFSTTIAGPSGGHRPALPARHDTGAGGRDPRHPPTDRLLEVEASDASHACGARSGRKARPSGQRPPRKSSDERREVTRPKSAAWLKGREVPHRRLRTERHAKWPRDLPQIRQRRRWWPFPVVRSARRPHTTTRHHRLPAQSHPGHQRPYPHRHREDPVHAQSSQGHHRRCHRLRHRRRDPHRPAVRAAGGERRGRRPIRNETHRRSSAAGCSSANPIKEQWDEKVDGVVEGRTAVSGRSAW